MWARWPLLLASPRDRGAFFRRVVERGLASGPGARPARAAGVGRCPSLERATHQVFALSPRSTRHARGRGGLAHSVIGRTGGKTTFFNLLTASTRPRRAGSSRRRTSRNAPHRIAHLESPDRSSHQIFPTLSSSTMSGWHLRPAGVLARLAWHGRPLSGPHAAARASAGEVGSRETSLPAREISHGEQRQLELAIALARPRSCCWTSRRQAVAGRDAEDVTLVRKLKAVHHHSHRAQDRLVMTMSDRIS